MKFRQISMAGLVAGLTLLTTGVVADPPVPGKPVCLEGNFMMADAMFSPFASANGPGRVLEVNIVTGARGITVDTPFKPDNKDNSDICPAGVVCELGPGGGVGGPFGDGSAPFKPTGVLSGGLNGHAFITSAAQHSITEFERDGDPIRTLSYNDSIGTHRGPPFGTVPRPLGTQMMPNGNIIQAICDANFDQKLPDGSPGPGSAPNTDPNPGYFPPVWSTPERAANSRLLVIDQETLQVIDEYSQPARGEPGHELWGCMAGIAFSEEGLFVSTFHGAAVLVIDWKRGLSGTSTGVGSNDPGSFKIGRKSNRARVTRVIDMLGGPGGPGDLNDPNRRDSLRAITFDAGGNLYATFRARSKACEPGETCNPGVFRHHIAVVPNGIDYPTRTIALDPGVNIIAGIRTNRMSAVACNNIGGPTAGGTNPDGTACDVETLLVAASAFNPDCTRTHTTPNTRGNECFVEGGGVGEYSIDPDLADATDGTCTGDATAGNTGCAQPIATYLGNSNGDDYVDPRMLMTIHEAFIQ